MTLYGKYYLAKFNIKYKILYIKVKKLYCMYVYLYMYMYM